MPAKRGRVGYVPVPDKADGPNLFYVKKGFALGNGNAPTTAPPKSSSNVLPTPTKDPFLAVNIFGEHTSMKEWLKNYKDYSFATIKRAQKYGENVYPNCEFVKGFPHQRYCIDVTPGEVRVYAFDIGADGWEQCWINVPMEVFTR